MTIQNKYEQDVNCKEKIDRKMIAKDFRPSKLTCDPYKKTQKTAE